MANCWLLCFLACVLCARSAVENLDVQTFPNGSFAVNVGGKQWFRSGSVGVRDLGQWWSQDEDSLQLTSHSTTTGSDKLGTFTVNQYDWKATGGASSLQVQTYINVYNEVPMVEFGLAYVNKATNTNISDYLNRTISSFPSFVIEEGSVERGYLTWSGSSEFMHDGGHRGVLLFLLSILWVTPAQAQEQPTGVGAQHSG